MTNLRQAAEMALKDLTRFCHAQAYDTVEALRQALARPEYQTVSAPQPQTFTGQNPYTADDITAVVEAIVTAFKLRREWIDLTNQEIEDLEACFSGFRLYRALENKFKEKNS